MVTNVGMDLGKWKNLFVADKGANCCSYNGNKCRIPQNPKIDVHIIQLYHSWALHSYVFDDVRKTLWQRNLRNSLCGLTVSEGRIHHVGRQGNKQTVAKRWDSHLEPQAYRRENKLETEWVFKFSKPTSSDILPPTWTHLLNFS